MAHIVDAWVAGFPSSHPGESAGVALRAKFSAEAFDALMRGQIEVAPFARELFPSERTRFARATGHDPLLVPIALGSRDTKGGTHAIALFVNAKNPLARMTMAQARAVFSGAGRAATWGDLGLGGAWAGRKISVHGMVRRRQTGDPPGIVNYLETALLEGRPWRPDLHEHVDQPGGPQALDLIVRAVAADEAAIGYSGFGYAVPGVKTLALGEAAAGPFYSGTPEEVARAEYPLTRTLYLCVDRNPPPPVRDFLAYALSSAGQRAVAASPEKFFPLPPARLAAARALLEQH